MLRTVGAGFRYPRCSGLPQRPLAAELNQQLVQVETTRARCCSNAASDVKTLFPALLIRSVPRWQPRTGFVSEVNSTRGGPPGYYQYQLLDFAFALAQRREQQLQARYSFLIKCVDRMVFHSQTDFVFSEPQVTC
jgi:hypothetical protein